MIQLQPFFAGIDLERNILRFSHYHSKQLSLYLQLAILPLRCFLISINEKQNQEEPQSQKTSQRRKHMYGKFLNLPNVSVWRAARQNRKDIPVMDSQGPEGCIAAAAILNPKIDNPRLMIFHADADGLHGFSLRDAALAKLIPD